MNKYIIIYTEPESQGKLQFEVHAADNDKAREIFHLTHPVGQIACVDDLGPSELTGRKAPQLCESRQSALELMAETALTSIARFAASGNYKQADKTLQAAQDSDPVMKMVYALMLKQTAGLN